MTARWCRGKGLTRNFARAAVRVRLAMVRLGRPLVLGHRGANRQAPGEHRSPPSRGRSRSAPTAWSSTSTAPPTARWSSTTTPTSPARGDRGARPGPSSAAALPEVPTLDEVARRVPGRLVNVEIKDCRGPDRDRPTRGRRAVVDLLRRGRWRTRRDRVVVRPGAVDRVRDARARRPDRWLTSGQDRSRRATIAASTVTRAAPRRADAAAGRPGRAWPSGRTGAVCAVNVWTVERADEMLRLARRRRRRVITDVPDVARTVLRA